MSYCLNPSCPQPHNPDRANFCQACGLSLWLRDRYRALKPIGEGGFGKTFLAVDEADPAKPQRVIKQFLPRGLGGYSQKSIELFHQEAERLAELGLHPQIPQLFDHLEWNGEHYLVQEFINGQNLEQELVQQGAFDEAKIRALLNDLLPVLNYIHRHHVIHRDIKPENIIRPVLGDRFAIVDFGASKYATGTALARTGTVIGSAGYVAPEQAIGKAEFSSDLYSLGVTCIHLLTGIHPFDLYSVSEDRWVWQQYLMSPISRNLAYVLDTLLQRATRQRYRTTTAALRDLRQGTEPPPAPEPPRRSPRLLMGQIENALSQWRMPATEPAPPPAAIARIERPTPLSRDRLPQRVDPIRPWHCLYTLTGHAGSVTAIAISPNGQLLASGSSDRTIKIWNLWAGELVHTFGSKSLWGNTGHSDRISVLAFSPDGHTLISGSDDSTIKLWDVSDQKLLMTLPGHGWVISAIAVSPAGDLLATGGGDGIINLWSLTTGALLEQLVKHRDRVSTLVISPDGKTLISGSGDRTLRFWDLRTHTLLNTVLAHEDGIITMTTTPDGRLLISGGEDCSLNFWDLWRGELLETIIGHGDRVNCVICNPTRQLFASASEDSTIRLWRLPDVEPICTLRHSWGVEAIAFSPDGRALVSGSADETIKIWQS